MSETATETRTCAVPGCRHSARESGYCGYHTPCPVCGELWGPVAHYASPGCTSHGLREDGTGHRAHCTCDACH